jgi:hypothetical protein
MCVCERVIEGAHFVERLEGVGKAVGAAEREDEVGAVDWGWREAEAGHPEQDRVRDGEEVEVGGVDMEEGECGTVGGDALDERDAASAGRLALASADMAEV